MNLSQDYIDLKQAVKENSEGTMRKIYKANLLHFLDESFANSLARTPYYKELSLPNSLTSDLENSITQERVYRELRDIAERGSEDLESLTFSEKILYSRLRKEEGYSTKIRSIFLKRDSNGAFIESKEPLHVLDFPLLLLKLDGSFFEEHKDKDSEFSAELLFLAFALAEYCKETYGDYRPWEHWEDLSKKLSALERASNLYKNSLKSKENAEATYLYDNSKGREELRGRKVSVKARLENLEKASEGIFRNNSFLNCLDEVPGNPGAPFRDMTGETLSIPEIRAHSYFSLAVSNDLRDTFKRAFKARSYLDPLGFSGGDRDASLADELVLLLNFSNLFFDTNRLFLRMNDYDVESEDTERLSNSIRYLRKFLSETNK